MTPSGSRYSERYAHGKGHRHAAAAGLTSGLVSYWKLDEASGATRADSVGGNDLADPAGENVAQAAGKILQAASFAGTSTNVLQNDALDLPTGSFTVSCWVNLADAGGLVTALAAHGVTASTRAWFLRYNSVNLQFVVSADGTADSATVAAGTLSNNTWAHVVAWHDSGGGAVGICVDGGEAVTTAYAGGRFAAAVFGLASAADAGFLIDELGIWSRVLTAGERAQLYNGGAGLPLASF